MLFLVVLFLNTASYDCYIEPETIIKESLFNEYPTYNTIITYLTLVSQLYPEKMSMCNIGQSHEGRIIAAVKISAFPEPTTKQNRPIILIDAGMHAREWMAPIVTMYLIYQLTQNTSNEYLYKDVDWIIIPMMNPDGYEFSHQYDEDWRKTTSPSNNCPCAGVDINRNFDVHWPESNGSCLEQCSVSYGGPYPFSEPETRALRDVALYYQDNIKLYINMHSYGTMILYPWSYKDIPVYNDDEHELVGNAVADVIRLYRGTNYDVGRTSNLLYLVPGSSCDWMAAKLGIPLNFGIELPKTKYNFKPPTEEIIPTAEETFEGFKIFHDYINKKWGKNNTQPNYY